MLFISVIASTGFYVIGFNIVVIGVVGFVFVGGVFFTISTITVAALGSAILVTATMKNEIFGLVLGIIICFISIASGFLTYRESKYSKRKNKLGKFCVWHLFVIIIMVYFGLYFMEYFDPLKQSVHMLLFLILIPLLNAPIDFISLGATRGLLYAMRNEYHNGFQILLFVFVDFLIALFLLILMNIIIVAAIGIANKVYILGWGEAVLFDITDILQKVKDTPFSKDNLWIYIIIATTFIPTVIHLILAVSVFILWLPTKILSWFNIDFSLLKNEQMDQDKLIAACAYVTVMPIFIILSPIAVWYIIYTFLFYNGGVIANGLVNILHSSLHIINII